MGLTAPQITWLSRFTHFPSTLQHFHSCTLTFPSWERGGNGGPRNVNESSLKVALARRYASYKQRAGGWGGRWGGVFRGGLLWPRLSGSCLVFSCVWCMLTLGPVKFGSSIKRPLWGWLSSCLNSFHWSHCLIKFSRETSERLNVAGIQTGGCINLLSMVPQIKKEATNCSQIKHTDNYCLINLSGAGKYCFCEVTLNWSHSLAVLADYFCPLMHRRQKKSVWNAGSKRYIAWHGCNTTTSLQPQGNCLVHLGPALSLPSQLATRA